MYQEREPQEVDKLMLCLFMKKLLKFGFRWNDLSVNLREQVTWIVSQMPSDPLQYLTDGPSNV